MARRPPGTRRAKSQDWVAPIGGWQTNVALIDMPATSASVLDNFFPESAYVRARYGSQIYASGFSGEVTTLMPYSGAVNKLFSASSSGIYDISSFGAIGSAVVSGLTNAYWSYAQFTTAGGKFLICVNGSDAARTFDGTSWSSSAITGPTSTNSLSVVASYRSRLWFIEKNTTKIWYLGTEAIQGAATSLNVGAVMRYGGVLVAIGTWSMPTVNGIIQHLVLVSSEGELIIYQGSDPADATNWSLMGTFKVGPPLGADRCLINVGADLAIMTVDAILPISKAITLDPAAFDQASITKNIAPTWLTTVDRVGSNIPGWQLITFPRRRMAIVNIPQTGGAIQYVMNTETGAWCRFTGLNAAHFVSWQNGLYFGTFDGAVMLAETGANDRGNPIACFMVGPFSRFNDGLSQKIVNLISCTAQIGLATTMNVSVSVDYVPSSYGITSLSGSSAATAKWGTAIWGTDVWPGTTTKQVFSSSTSIGRALAPTVCASISGNSASTSDAIILGGSILYEKGQPI